MVLLVSGLLAIGTPNGRGTVLKLGWGWGAGLCLYSGLGSGSSYEERHGLRSLCMSNNIETMEGLLMQDAGEMRGFRKGNTVGCGEAAPGPEPAIHSCSSRCEMRLICQGSALKGAFTTTQCRGEMVP